MSKIKANGEVRYNSTILKAKRIYEIYLEHFEPGVQSKSGENIYRKYIEKQLGISKRTYTRALRIARNTNFDEL
jgi:hypothetical protein